MTAAESIPLGVSLHPNGDAVEFRLLSRGDRVLGRLHRDPAAAQRPLVLLAGPDGCAVSEWSEALAERCLRFANVASIDLPLCGSRHGEKLTELALDPAHPIATRLREELVAQTSHDLRLCVRALRDVADLRPSALGFAAAGLGADLGRDFASGFDALDAVVISEVPASDAVTLDALARDLERGLR